MPTQFELRHKHCYDWSSTFQKRPKLPVISYKNKSRSPKAAELKRCDSSIKKLNCGTHTAAARRGETQLRSRLLNSALESGRRFKTRNRDDAGESARALAHTRLVTSKWKRNCKKNVNANVNITNSNTRPTLCRWVQRTRHKFPVTNVGMKLSCVHEGSQAAKTLK